MMTNRIDREEERDQAFGSFKLNVVEASLSDKRIRGAPRDTLQQLLFFMNKKTWDTFVSQDVIAAKTGYSRTSIINACRKLEKLKWIRRRKTDYGGYVYVINEQTIEQFLIVAQQQKEEGQAGAKRRSREAYRGRVARQKYKQECGEVGLTTENPECGEICRAVWLNPSELCGEAGFTLTPHKNNLHITPSDSQLVKEVVVEGERDQTRREVS